MRVFRDGYPSALPVDDAPRASSAAACLVPGMLRALATTWPQRRAAFEADTPAIRLRFVFIQAALPRRNLYE